MDRTLYLTQNPRMIVRRDGPSLWIKVQGQAGQRVPARLVSRVIIAGEVKMDSGVVTLFTEKGTPVTFLDGEGKVVATALGVVTDNERVRERQERLVWREENRSRFLDWMRARKKQCQLSLLRKLCPERVRVFESVGFTDGDYETVIASYFARDPRHSEAVRRTIRGLFHEAVVDLLLYAELDPHLGVLHRRQNFGLVHDLCEILQPEMDRQAIQVLKRESGHKVPLPEHMRVVAEVFEWHRPRIVQRADQLIDEIFVFMREGLV